MVRKWQTFRNRMFPPAAKFSGSPRKPAAFSWLSVWWIIDCTSSWYRTYCLSSCSTISFWLITSSADCYWYRSLYCWAAVISKTTSQRFKSKSSEESSKHRSWSKGIKISEIGFITNNSGALLDHQDGAREIDAGIKIGNAEDPDGKIGPREATVGDKQILDLT